MSKYIKGFISISLILGAVFIAFVLVKTAPEAKRKKPKRMAPLVETAPLKAADQTILLELTGTVMASKEVELRARISGEIIKTAPEFIAGGTFKKEAPLLKIDPVDYVLALSEAEAQLQTATFNHKMELGRQGVAAREWSLLKTDDATEQEKELALRIPHLAASEAALKSAQAKLQRAKLNLARTEIKAPFNGVIIDQLVNVGSQATGPLANLVGTDHYWIKVPVSIDRLPWINIPEGRVEIKSGAGAVREGRIIKLLGNLEKEGRMAQLLVEVKDPLCLLPENSDKGRLLIGEFVNVTIHGRSVKGVYSIPRNALHENDTVWIAKDEKLDIRTVDVIWRSTNTLLIKNNIANGELLITSNLDVPMQGREITTPNKKKSAQQKQKQQKSGAKNKKADGSKKPSA